MVDSGLAPVDTMRDTGHALVRVYAAPVPGTGADHTWFVVKRADSTEIHRWEVFVYSAEPYGYVFQDLFEPEADLGIGGTYVVSEMVGPDAEPLIDCIENAAVNYPCRDYYLIFPGPNSDSFTQWVLNTCGWDVELPPTVVGTDVLCPLGQ